MQRLPTTLEGPILIESVAHGDDRGFFMETYRRSTFLELGVTDDLVQDNHSRSRQGIVRGMHFQPGMAQARPLRRGARSLTSLSICAGARLTFGQWEMFELSDGNRRQLYCPNGFAHGFCVLSDDRRCHLQDLGVLRRLA